ncbi:uncharacterized protein B0T23DRAFT_411912 [Neurospora hispaniola]|uniref:Uncharacterized protein n=1 Tax=Neurospora hispaniola TaxID=588809 RepID=A0AAJ0MT41_9PEZI|nr:hypothetical protein B0T23DRAFT_411912 [Neurospora hispaniola]
MSREIPASPSAELSVSSTSCRPRPFDRRRSGRQANLDGDGGNCPDEKAAGRQKLLQYFQTSVIGSRMAATGNSQVSSMGWPVKVLGTTTPIVTLARSLITGMEATDNLRNGRKHDEFWTKRNSETFDAFLDRLTVDHNGSVQWLSMAPNGFPAKGAETIRFEEVNDFDLAWSRT